MNIPFESILVNPKTFEKDIKKFNNDYICFNALHGTFGEDGKIQKILDNLSFRYTHSNALTSKIAFNKDLTKKNISDLNILTPTHRTINFTEITQKKLSNLFSDFGAFVIKPVSSGSSFGVKIIKREKDIKSFLADKINNAKLYKNHTKLLIEKFVEGRELTVSVIEKKNESLAIAVTEIKSKNIFFDYQSKYEVGFSKHILPANISSKAYKKCLDNAKLVHDKVLCRGLSRSDFIIENDNVYFLEINTQPGLTKISLVPEQLKYLNITFDDMIMNLIKCSL